VLLLFHNLERCSLDIRSDLSKNSSFRYYGINLDHIDKMMIFSQMSDVFSTGLEVIIVCI